MASLGPLRVAVAGLGTVGGGVINVLKGNAGIIASRCMRPVEVVAAADIAVPQGVDMEGITFYDDAVKMAAEADVDVVVETIGGYGVALTCVLAAACNQRAACHLLSYKPNAEHPSSPLA